MEAIGTLIAKVHVCGGVVRHDNGYCKCSLIAAFDLPGLLLDESYLLLPGPDIYLVYLITRVRDYMNNR